MFSKEELRSLDTKYFAVIVADEYDVTVMSRNTGHATVSGESGQEKAAAELTVAESDLAFTVRFCKRAAEVTADGFRILFGGEIYNIVAVDHMNYKKKTLKFRCEKARR